MIYYGTLLESYVSTPNEWSRYLRVVFCVEIGYGLEIIRTNVFGKDQIEKQMSTYLNKIEDEGDDYINLINNYHENEVNKKIEEIRNKYNAINQ